MSEQWIDVSAHQGAVNWPQVAAAGIKGTILRAGYGNDLSQTDTQFLNNIRGATAAGLKTAVYWFGYADSVQDALAEWAACRQAIGPYRGSILFVAYDYEYDSVRYYREKHGAAPGNGLVNQMADTFLRAAKADGWETVLYTNNDYRLHVFSASLLAAWDLWLADYADGPDVPCAIQQTTNSGAVPGIAGNVDLDTVFKAYGVPQTIVEIDTTMDLSRAHGQYYTVKTVCPQQVTLTAGTGGVVTVVPFPKTGDVQLFALVAVGQPGTETGIYTAAPGESPLKRFVFGIL